MRLFSRSTSFWVCNYLRGGRGGQRTMTGAMNAALIDCVQQSPRAEATPRSGAGYLRETPVLRVHLFASLLAEVSDGHVHNSDGGCSSVA